MGILFGKKLKQHNSCGHPDSLPNPGRPSSSYEVTEGLPLPKTVPHQGCQGKRKHLKSFPVTLEQKVQLVFRRIGETSC